MVAVGGFFALRSVAIDKARGETAVKVEQSGQLVESQLDDGILTGAPAAVQGVDGIVIARVLSPSVVRVKIWSAAGRILYADEPQLIGRRYPLDEDERRLLRDGGSEVELSDLSRPENEFDRLEGDLLEAYTRIRSPSGEPLLFEIYERVGSVRARAQDLLSDLAPTLIVCLAVLLLAQAPLVLSLTRRLQRQHAEREELLLAAIDSSNRERRRIASYLHDGSVQDVAGVAFGLAPLADRARAEGDQEEAAALDGAVTRLRQIVRDLRMLLVDLHPPRLADAGLEAALADLVSPLASRGTEVHVDVTGAGLLAPAEEALAYRVAQEALRNVLAHAQARTVDVELTVTGDGLRLVVHDDGRGFDRAVADTNAAGGHLGLSLLDELVAQAGGTLRIRSVVGEGTRIELELARR
ncbi:MAG TPA: ATP-binding protein [Gaiellaceae bacterium]|nr:ATP-binding protein [Gaiellaceae bacterium]